MSKKKYQSSRCTVIDIQPKQHMMAPSTIEVPYDPDKDTDEALSREHDVTNYNVWEQ
jgi:hypothetical protein